MGFANPAQPPSTVTLAPGSVVDLASGASVGLANGSQVALASGAQVGLTDGANKVLTTASPDQFWPCRSGEANPPTFGGSAGYSTKNGQTVVQLLAAATTPTATYATLCRYSAYGRTIPLVARWMAYIGPNSSNGLLRVGFGSSDAVTLTPTSSGISLDFRVTDSNGNVQIGANNFNIVAALGLPTSASTWVEFEVVFAPTYTRLTINGNTTAGRFTIPYGAGDSSLSSWVATGSTVMTHYVSNLLAYFTNQVPA